MRRLMIFSVVVLALTVATATVSAADIPDRPEKLVYPELTFEVPDADSLRFELADGTPVYAKKDSQFPLVNITVSFRGGRYLEPDGKAGLAAITGDAWRSGGAGDYTAQDLDEELDFLAANLSTSIGDVTGSVSLNVLSKDLDAAMAIMMDVLTKPRFQTDRFAKTKDNMLQAMKQRNDDTADIEAREWDRLIYGDTYWMNKLATKASVDAVSADDCKAFVSSLIRSGNLVIAVAGDFDQVEMEALLNRTVATLPKLEKALPAIPQPAAPTATGVYVINKSDVNQGRVSIGQLGYKLGAPNQFPLMIGNDILGGGGFTARMMKTIRSDEGLAYSAYSALNFPTTMPGQFRAYYQSKSSTCGYAAEIFFDLLDSMRTAPPTDEELRTAKASFIETFPRQFASAGQVVGLYATDELLGRPHSYWTEYRGKVAAVTGSEIEEAMTADLDPSKMIMLVVGNVEEIMKGHPEHEAKLSDFGKITELPLRDPMTLEPMTE
jgi:predicted Zn-dependent peptidase